MTITRSIETQGSGGREQRVERARTALDAIAKNEVRQHELRAGHEARMYAVASRIAATLGLTVEKVLEMQERVAYVQQMERILPGAHYCPNCRRRIA